MSYACGQLQYDEKGYLITNGKTKIIKFLNKTHIVVDDASVIGLLQDCLANNPSVHTVTFAKNVDIQQIESRVVFNSPNLKTIYFLNETTVAGSQGIGDNAFIRDGLNPNFTIRVPSSMINKYMNDPNWAYYLDFFYWKKNGYIGFTIFEGDYKDYGVLVGTVDADTQGNWLSFYLRNRDFIDVAPNGIIGLEDAIKGNITWWNAQSVSELRSIDLDEASIAWLNWGTDQETITAALAWASTLDDNNPVHYGEKLKYVGCRGWDKQGNLISAQSNDFYCFDAGYSGDMPVSSIGNKFYDLVAVGYLRYPNLEVIATSGLFKNISASFGGHLIFDIGNSSIEESYLYVEETYDHSTSSASTGRDYIQISYIFRYRKLPQINNWAEPSAGKLYVLYVGDEDMSDEEKNNLVIQYRNSGQFNNANQILPFKGYEDIYQRISANFPAYTGFDNNEIG